MTKAPPELWGWAPLEAPTTDFRWAKVEGKRLGLRPIVTVDLPLLDAVHKCVRTRVEYKPDMADHWQDPATTWKRQTGDCEDMAILARAILLERGLADEEVFFLIARDLITRSDHALLLIRGNVTNWIMDSQNPHGVMRVDKVKDYVPRFAYQGRRTWMYGRKKK